MLGRDLQRDVMAARRLAPIVVMVALAGVPGCRCGDDPSPASLAPGPSSSPTVAPSAPPIDCTEPCAARAECHPEATAGAPRCVATDRSCREHERCGRFGFCRASEGVCVATGDEGCRDSDRCRQFGECVAEGRRCVAKADADCEASLYCERLAQCTAEDGKCVASAEDCRAHGSCRARGLCTPEGGRCVAGSIADCAASLRCEKLGECLLREGRCVATR